MYILDGIKDKHALEVHVVAHGGKSQAENQAVFDKWFRPGPRLRTMEVIKKYGLDSKTVIDISIGWGITWRIWVKARMGLRLIPML
jgi:hypothetical protein